MHTNKQQRCRNPKTKRNAWIGQHWIYVFCNPSCWLINELPLPPPSNFIRSDTIVLLLFWMGRQCMQPLQRSRQRGRKKWFVVLPQRHTPTAWNFLIPQKIVHKQDECTTRVPKQCKHVQLIGDESLVISFRILAWSIFISASSVWCPWNMY